MTVAEFKKKWARYQGKEWAAYQEHLIDLCHILGQPTPVEADPSGNDFFCFQKRVVKNAHLLNVEHPDRGDPTEHGFADVWRKDCFGWEYKGKKKDLVGSLPAAWRDQRNEAARAFRVRRTPEWIAITQPKVRAPG